MRDDTIDEEERRGRAYRAAAAAFVAVGFGVRAALAGRHVDELVGWVLKSQIARARIVFGA
jgi:hypothetical protein